MPGLAIREAFHADGGEHFSHARALFCLAYTTRHQAIGDILSHRHMRKQRVILKDNADFAQIGRQIIHGTVANHHLAGCLTNEARDDTQQRRLAAARRAKQRDQLAGFHFQRHIINGTRIAIAVNDPVQQQLLRGQALGRLRQGCNLPKTISVRQLPCHEAKQRRPDFAQ